MEVARGENLHQYLVSELLPPGEGNGAQNLSNVCVAIPLVEFRTRTKQLCTKIVRELALADIVELGRAYHKLNEHCLKCDDVLRRIRVIYKTLRAARLPKSVFTVAKWLSKRYPKTRYLKIGILDFVMVFSNFRELVKIPKYHKFWSQGVNINAKRLSATAMAKRYMAKEMRKLTILNRDLKRKIDTLENQHYNLVEHTRTMEHRHRASIKRQILKTIKEMDEETLKNLRRNV